MDSVYIVVLAKDFLIDSPLYCWAVFFFSFLFLLLVSLYWFVVCFFFCMGRPAETVLLAAGCLFILFDGSGVVLRLIRIDNFLPSFLVVVSLCRRCADLV